MAMEKVEGMMKKLQLSAAERKGVKIGTTKVDALPQAIGKLFSEKPAPPEALEQALGRIWCPLRGIEVTDWGENHFLFTFHQASGKRKALEDGPWMLSNELVAVVDFDGTKTLEEFDFSFILIWVRVANLPLGMLNKATGEVAGEEVGEVLEVDVAENGMAIGRVLRIKIKMDIKKPIMRGITVCVGESREGRWCPLTYEHLPDFCYVCGIIGHTDHSCEIKVGKNDIKQYSAELRHYIPRRKGGGEFAGGRGGAAWRSSFTSAHSFVVGSGSREAGGRSRSDAPTWKKSATMNDGGGNMIQEVASNSKVGGVAEKIVEGGGGMKGNDGAAGVNAGESVHVHSDMQAMHVDAAQLAIVTTPFQEKEMEEENEKAPQKFKRRPRVAGLDGNDASLGDGVGNKHKRDEEEVGEEGRKRSKAGSSEVHNKNVEAGLSE